MRNSRQNKIIGKSTLQTQREVGFTYQPIKMVYLQRKPSVIVTMNTVSLKDKIGKIIIFNFIL